MDSEPLSKAHDLKIDSSQAAKDDIRRAIKRECGRLRVTENPQAIRIETGQVEKHGLRFARYR